MELLREPRVKVLLLDSRTAVRCGLSAMLMSDDRFDVIEDLPPGRGVVALAKDLNVRVVVAD